MNYTLNKKKSNTVNYADCISQNPKIKKYHRYLNSKEAKTAKKISYDPKHQSPEQASYSLKILILTVGMFQFGKEWRRLDLYNLFAVNVIGARIIRKDGEYVLDHLNPNSRYANLSFKKMCWKVDHIIANLIEKGYLEIGKHNKHNLRYAKNFLVNVTNSRILKKNFAEDSLGGKNRLPYKYFSRTSSSRQIYLDNENISNDNNIIIDANINRYFHQQLYSDRKNWFYYRNVKDQSIILMRKLKKMIFELGTYTYSVPRIGRKQMKLLWYKPTIYTRQDGKKTRYLKICGRKEAKSLGKHICSMAKEIKYGLSSVDLNSLLSHMDQKYQELEKMLYQMHGRECDNFTHTKEKGNKIEKKITIKTERERKIEDYILSQCRGYGIPISNKDLNFNHSNKTFFFNKKVMKNAFIRLSINRTLSNNMMNLLYTPSREIL